MHGDASSSLCVRAKNQQISVCGEWYANHLRMAQHRFAVPFTHTRIWFANCLRVVREPFGALVYTRLKLCALTKEPYRIAVV